MSERKPSKLWEELGKMIRANLFTILLIALFAAASAFLLDNWRLVCGVLLIIRAVNLVDDMVQEWEPKKQRGALEKMDG